MSATTIVLNGRTVTAVIEPRTHLADFCREHEGLTGTHLGCEHGVCGACTVDIDGEIARSCITFAVACDGAAIRTIEGFADDPLMARLRTAFSANHALQCGYCTPGMLIAAHDYIRRIGNGDDAAIRVAMSGNLCRCTGYQGIVEAIKSVILEGEAGNETRAPVPSPLGPVGSLTSTPTKESPPISVIPASPRPASAAASKTRKPSIAVTTSVFRDVGGTTHFDQDFSLPHPRNVVWDAMRNIDILVACLPGATIAGPIRPDGTFQGGITVAFGPIVRSFGGSGTFAAYDEKYSAHIEGVGHEERGSSAASGSMRFDLIDEGEAETRIKACIAYRLTGPLAQFGQASLVRAMVTEIGSMFATNLNAALSGFEPSEARHISAFTMAFSLIRAWFAKRFSRLKP